MGKFQRSMQLAKASWATLKADRELLFLPVLSFFAAVLVLGVFGGMVWMLDSDTVTTAAEASGEQTFELSPVSYILLILMGILLAIVGTYFQAAMVSGARERLHGGDPTVGSALSAATSRLSVIIPWALFSWTVGVILRAIEERLGVIGRIFGSLGQMAFKVVTFLAVPVLVAEQMGPLATLKRSGELFKQTWGENLIAQVGLGIISFIVGIGGLMVAILLAVAIHPILGIVFGVLFFATLIVVSTSLTAVYQTALYEYVTTHEIPTNFEQADLPGAFRTK